MISSSSVSRWRDQRASVTAQLPLPGNQTDRQNVESQGNRRNRQTKCTAASYAAAQCGPTAMVNSHYVSDLEVAENMICLRLEAMVIISLIYMCIHNRGVKQKGVEEQKFLFYPASWWQTSEEGVTQSCHNRKAAKNKIEVKVKFSIYHLPHS